MWLAAVGALFLAASPEAPAPLVFSAPVDGTITGVGAAIWIGTEAAKQELAPPACRWCDRAADGTDRLNALDAWGRGLRWGANQGTADVLSSALAFGALPAGLFAVDGVLAWRSGNVWAAPVDVLIALESMVMAELATQAVKFAVARARPFAHALAPADEAALTDRDSHLSFFSGHSSFVFSLTVAMGTVARMRGYALAWLVWAVGLPLAVAVPYLRMAADRHYLVDVATGSAVGALVGFAVPTLFHRRIELGPVHAAVAASPGGAGVEGTF